MQQVLIHLGVQANQPRGNVRRSRIHMRKRIRLTELCRQFSYQPADEFKRRVLADALVRDGCGQR